MKVAIKAVLAGGALALLASPAQAATYRYNYSLHCNEDPDYLYTPCSSESGQFNSTYSRGVWVYSGKGTSFFSVSYQGNTYYTETYAVKFTNVTSRGNEVNRAFYRDAIKFDGLNCIAEQRYIFSAGQVRVDDYTLECT